MIEGAAAAFDAYLRIRHRLPDARFGGAPIRAATLERVADPYDAILLDAYGVLDLG